LERVDQLENRVHDLDTNAQRRPQIDREALLVHAHAGRQMNHCSSRNIQHQAQRRRVCTATDAKPVRRRQDQLDGLTSLLAHAGLSTSAKPIGWAFCLSVSRFRHA
jgi:hypothetical protein